jgi:transcriptional regulator with XRE-family HTH domain
MTRALLKASKEDRDAYVRFLTQLRATREARKLTQGELASRIRLSRAQYTAIENGRSLVNFVHLHNLSLALGVRWTVGDRKLPPARFVT